MASAVPQPSITVAAARSVAGARTGVAAAGGTPAPESDLVGTARRWLGNELRQLIVGGAPPVRDFSRPLSGDPGLFGPDSVTWQIHGDAAMLVGGVRALLLQTMHPLAMAGIAQHSRYREDPAGRLWQTSRYVGTVTFGTVAQARAAVRGVRRAHDRVRGTAPDGRPYAANDPHLLAWVHHTLVDSFLTAYRQFGGSAIDDADADRYIAEQQQLAVLLGCEPVADSVAALREWMRRERPQLGAGPDARAAARFLLFPPLAPAARPAYAVIAAAAAGTLPSWVRLALRIPVLPLTNVVAVQPAAYLLTRTIDWAMKGAG